MARRDSATSHRGGRAAVKGEREMRKACAVCGNEFDARGSAITCGESCRKGRTLAYWREHCYPRRYVSKLKGDRRACEVCGEEYTPRGWCQRTCRAAACVKELRRQCLAKPEIRAKRQKQAAARRAIPEFKKRAAEYNRTSPKYAAFAARCKADGRTAIYCRNYRRRIQVQKAAAELSKIRAVMEAKL